MSNIILITIDSLRYDHLGCYGYYRDTSPNIDSLATKGAKFLAAISNGGQTPQAFPAILASALPPLEKAEARAILERNTTLAELLRNAGYRTAAFHSNPHVSRFYGYSRGFDVFDDGLQPFSPKEWRIRLRTWGKSPDSLAAKMVQKVSQILRPVLSRVPEHPIVSAEQITNKSISWLEKRNPNFFLWLHYMDVHYPYLPPAKQLTQFCARSVSRKQMRSLYTRMMKKPEQLSKADVEALIDLYDASIKYVDEVIGRLLDKLEKHLANTLVIVTADHGDEFGEHGTFAHQTLYDGLLHVPLLMAGPGIEGGTVVRQQVSLIDLAPTIAELVRIDSAQSMRGRSLLPMIEGEEEAVTGAISTFVSAILGHRNIAYRLPNWKYIGTESLDGTDTVLAEEVYDLTNDPGETRNLHGAGDEQANGFELEAKRRIAQFKRARLEEATGYEKQRIKAKLGNLGKL